MSVPRRVEQMEYFPLFERISIRWNTLRYSPRLGPLILLTLLLSSGLALATDYVSVQTPSAILYDGPSNKSKKKFVVNRYMPFEKIVTLQNWVKVRDSKGEMSWVEQRVLSDKRYVFVTAPVLPVYAEASETSAVLFRVKQQVALEYLSSSGQGWLKIKHADGDSGFVRAVDVWGD